MPDVKDTRTVIDSLRRCCHAGVYDDTGPGESCDGCAYYRMCSHLELDAAELILLLDELTDHQFEIDRDALIDLRHCNGCNKTGYYYRCRARNMYGDSSCDKIQSDAADILEKMYHRYNIMHALGRQDRPFFVKSPNGTWEPINERIEPPIDTFLYVGRKNGKTYLDSIACDGFRGGKIYDVKTYLKEDIKDMMDATAYFASIINQVKERDRKRFETSFTPRSIEQSADHKTVCVLWQDGSKTIVKLSKNDKDDIDTAFTYALAKRIFGTNTHLKKVVRQKLNEHKSKIKKLPSNPNPKEIPIELEYVKDAKELFLESHLIYNVRINFDLMDTGEIRVHMYNPLKGTIAYMKNVKSTQEALSKMESMWQEFNTEKEAEDATGR